MATVHRPTINETVKRRQFTGPVLTIYNPCTGRQLIPGGTLNRATFVGPPFDGVG